MQAIILAAGMGKRLGELTRNSTKCMVKIDGKRLIEYALDALAAQGIRKAVIVTGHGADEFQEVLGPSYSGISVSYVHNPDYARTNNIYSLFLAREAMEEDDSILLESDLIFEPAIIRDSVLHPSPNVAVVARFESWMDGTVTRLGEDHDITCFLGKKEMVESELAQYYKTVNIYKLSRAFCRDKFFPFLDVYIKAKGLNEYYEEVFKLLTFIDRGALKALDVSGRLWYEIDDLQDLDIAHALFAKGEPKVKALHARYGGYWRFPKLKDYCYLVNPYFPTPAMFAEMARSFPTLVANYPSGQNVQNLLAAKMFEISPEHILVGNGASELIKALFRGDEGPVGIPVPTFDEYRACAGPENIKPFAPSRPDFRYTADDLLDFCSREQVSSLILINPDNPSGNFIPRQDAVRLAEGLAEKKIRLIYDESFLDFADGSDDHSLIEPDLLNRLPNLTAVKSISKSYGVPGLRLGIIASSDLDLLRRIRNEVSIWNINSPAEHFLQVIDKHRNDFRSACRQIVLERERFILGLRDIPYLRALPSHANYVLCEILPPWTPAGLSEILLNEFDILIKDASGKLGFSGRPFVRLTVRDQADDDQLLAALRALIRA
ncbi:MAG: aminotransferase class I/II-fold pyridoxal phosphate-dependent enzyme [Candidatus Aminicenantes bacterium]|nr:aminotransferase class I/II-fold pyridoxal phosphate-dependent enzyme [Candidatus Aminicenantes bacterium]